MASVLKVDQLQGVSNANNVIVPGAIIQTQVGYVTAWTTTTSYALVSTGLAVTITPKFNTSNVLITIALNGVYTQEAAHYVRIHLYKGGSNLSGISTAHGQALASSSNETEYATGLSTVYLDSPATTSATTYKLQIRGDNTNSPLKINRYSETNDYYGVSTLTLREVSA